MMCRGCGACIQSSRDDAEARAWRGVVTMARWADAAWPLLCISATRLPRVTRSKSHIASNQVLDSDREPSGEAGVGRMSGFPDIA